MSVHMETHRNVIGKRHNKSLTAGTFEREHIPDASHKVSISSLPYPLHCMNLYESLDGKAVQKP